MNLSKVAAIVLILAGGLVLISGSVSYISGRTRDAAARHGFFGGLPSTWI